MLNVNRKYRKDGCRKGRTNYWKHYPNTRSLNRIISIQHPHPIDMLKMHVRVNYKVLTSSWPDKMVTKQQAKIAFHFRWDWYLISANKTKKKVNALKTRPKCICDNVKVTDNHVEWSCRRTLSRTIACLFYLFTLDDIVDFKNIDQHQWESR